MGGRCITKEHVVACGAAALQPGPCHDLEGHPHAPGTTLGLIPAAQVDAVATNLVTLKSLFPSADLSGQCADQTMLASMLQGQGTWHAQET